MNTNTFFRAPAVTEETPKLVEPLGEPCFRIGDLPRNRWVATLPSPHALAASAAGELAPRAVAEGVLGPQIRWLAQNGCAIVVLQETALFGGGIDVHPLVMRSTSCKAHCRSRCSSLSGTRATCWASFSSST